MKTKRVKVRRKLRTADFRKSYRLASGLILLEDGNYIDVSKINEAFPDKAKRLDYLNALIEGLQ